MMHNEQGNLIHYKKYMTNFHDREIGYDDNIDDANYKDKLYSLDLNGQMHLNLIPGILRLSSKKFKTTTNGYIMKDFDPVFGFLPTFMVKTNKLKDNIDKYVIVRPHIVTSDQRKSIIGTIEKYIGNVGDIATEMNLCKIFSTCHWSKKIDKMNWTLSKSESNCICTKDLTPERLDMTTISTNHMITVSVDPLGSKDIDDAISIEIKSENECIVGIHIADPTSYIIENSILDNEVAKRCESIYLKNEHIHMFPNELSTHLFSLNQNKNNRAFSVIIGLRFGLVEGGTKWEITSKEIKKTIIRVDRNMTYEQFEDEHKNDTKLNTLYKIGKILYNSVLDPQNTVPYESKKMIEIFMVIANNLVADKMIELSNEKQLSQIIIRAQKPKNHSVDSVLNDYVEINGTLESKELVEAHHRIRRHGGELRIFSKSNPESNKHSSLNLNTYTHFTSPIRRYSDILVHRLLYNLISKKEIFKLMDSPGYIHQLFLMNHYKKYYRLINQLEQDIIVTHHVIKFIPNPWDRIWQVNGIIIDVSEKKKERSLHGLHQQVTRKKIVVKCTGCDQNDNEISHYLINTVHTLWINTQNQDQNYNDIDICAIASPKIELTLFKTIKFKICFLSKDMKKIRSYI